MNNDNLNIQEDAKSDWMKVVTKHKKKQRGLPALSRLNANAGNVEYNVSTFNHMQADSVPTVNPVNGSVVESVELLNNNIHSGYVVLNYDNIPVTIDEEPYSPTSYYDPAFGNYLPRDHRTHKKYISWKYEADLDQVCEFLMSIPDVSDYIEKNRSPEDPDGEKLFDEILPQLLNKYEEELLDEFYEYAVEDAQKNHEYTESYERDTLDDRFDMSLRTFL